MRITAVKLHVLELPVRMARALGDLSGPMSQVDEPLRVKFIREFVDTPPKTRVTLLRIQTNQGVEGFCTGADPGMVTTLRSDLVGADPQQHGYIYQKLLWAVRFKHFHINGLAPFDNALWDLRAKLAGMPLHRFLGSVKEKVPCYLSAPHYPTPEESIEEATSAKKRGFLGYKLHAFFGWEKDIEVCRRVREATGPDFYLMQDAAQTYSYPEAVKVGRALEELKFHWLEEPVRDVDLYNLQRLAQELEIPIATTELLGGDLQAIAQHIYMKAGDIVRTDTNRAGISTVMRIAHLAEAYWLNVELTSMGACFGLANIHAIQAIPNTSFYEDWDNQLPLMEALGCRHVTSWEKGYIRAPEAPGFGLEPDEKLVKKYTVAEY